MTTEQVQHLLAYLGYYVGTVDGQWGTLSKTACKAFQRDFGLEADGIPGDDTQKALKHSVAYGMEKLDSDNPKENNSEETFWDDISNFKRIEFACKCGGRYCNGFPAEPKEAMVRIAQAAREHFGKPASVISGLRCEQWNAYQGGVDNSQHMYGEACDLAINGVSSQQLLDFFLSQPGVRYAYKINSTNIHFDIPKGTR